jgi:23S rRNA (guanosine2251-2'-O)-methyltransferase
MSHSGASSDSDWIVGFHAVLGALSSGRPVEVVWLQKGRRDQRLQRVLDAARERGVAARWVPRGRLDELAGDSPHNGCAARCGPQAFARLDEIVAAEGMCGRLLLVDDVSDPHNLGALIRTAAAFAVDGVIVAGPAAPPLGGAVARAAAGLLGRVPLVRATVAADVLVQLRGAGYWAFGADPEGQPISSVRPADRWVLCVGAEERGLRAKTRSQIDEPVRVPMAEGVESLNVSVAAGVLLYHLCRLWTEAVRR